MKRTRSHQPKPSHAGRLNRAVLIVLLLTPFAGCDLDPSNPNNPTEGDVLNTRDGLIAATIGLQSFYNASTIDNLVLTPAITARELAINTTFQNLQDLEAGCGVVTNINQSIDGLFLALYRVLSDAEAIEAGAQAVETVEDDLESGIVGLALFYQAAALGGLAQSFTHVAVNTGPDAPYIDREQAFTEAVNRLDQAEQTLLATPPGEVFQGLLPAGFDLLNTIRAYRARFALFGGAYQAAIDAANSVDQGATSVFAGYSDQDPNPISDAFSPDPLDGSWAARDDLGLESVQAGDQRIGFYTTPADVESVPNNLPIDILTGFTVDGLSASLPAYLPGELNLIRAEAHVRLGQTADAVTEIDAVRTKTPAEDPFGVGADLPAYSGPETEQALLDEIFYQRSVELYLQGMRMEDARRLGQSGPSTDIFQRNRDFYPFPQSERINNANTPEDPPAGC